MFPDDIQALSADLIDQARRVGVRIVTAESCTGGLAAAAICSVSGASDVFERGFITYANLAKQEMLGVPANLIRANGAVSEPVALAMAAGALHKADAQVALAITGIAGPGGGSARKPVGLVHFAVARTGRKSLHRVEQFSGGRHEIQISAVRAGLNLIREALA